MQARSAWEELVQTLPAEDREALAKMAAGGGGPRRWGLGERSAVLVVDMTRAFIEDRFPTGWGETGEPCMSAVARLLDEVRQFDVPIVYTTYERTSREAEIGAWFRGDVENGRFPFTGPPVAMEVPEPIAPRPQDMVVVKAKPSAFFGTQLQALLTYLRVDSLIVTGMVTSGCIRATVTDAFSLNYRVVVPVECVADRCQLSHRVELIDMGAKYADLVHLDELLSEGEMNRRLRDQRVGAYREPAGAL